MVVLLEEGLEDAKRPVQPLETMSHMQIMCLQSQVVPCAQKQANKQLAAAPTCSSESSTTTIKYSARSHKSPNGVAVAAVLLCCQLLQLQCILSPVSQCQALIQVPNRHTVASIPGDLVLGILVPVHERPSPKQAQTRTCGAVREQYGIQRVEAAFRTIDSINADPDILPNITLGIEIRDSCWHSPIALEQSIEFIRDAMAASEQSQLITSPTSGLNTAAAGDTPTRSLRLNGVGQAIGTGQQQEPGGPASPNASQQHACAPYLKQQLQLQQSSKKIKNLVGVVGPASSGDTVQVQNLLQLFNMPQVGYSATSRDLSNKNFFKYFLRVVPSDKLQAQVLIDLMLAHNWTYITVVYTEGSYGSSLMNAFRERAQEVGICFATLESMPPNADDAKFDELIEAIQNHRNARVVICMCEGRTIARLFAGFKRSNISNEYLVVGSDGWSDRFDVVNQQEEIALGGISIRIHSAYVHDFDDYYFALNPFNNHRNPWFAEFWEQRFQCNLEYPSQQQQHQQQQQQQQRPTFIRPANARVYNRTCSGRDSLRQNHKQDAKMAFVQKSIITMALGLDSMQRAMCGPNRPGLCPEMLPVNGSIFLQHLMNVTFSFLDEEVYFDEQGDPPGKYEILNFQRKLKPSPRPQEQEQEQQQQQQPPPSSILHPNQSPYDDSDTVSRPSVQSEEIIKSPSPSPTPTTPTITSTWPTNHNSYSTLRVYRTNHQQQQQRPADQSAPTTAAERQLTRRQRGANARPAETTPNYIYSSDYSSTSDYEYVHVGSWKSSDGLSLFGDIHWPSRSSIFHHYPGLSGSVGGGSGGGSSSSGPSLSGSTSITTSSTTTTTSTSTSTSTTTNSIEPHLNSQVGGQSSNGNLSSSSGTNTNHNGAPPQASSGSPMPSDTSDLMGGLGGFYASIPNEQQQQQNGANGTNYGYNYRAPAPKSVCSLPCAKGHAKKIQSDSVKCCWVCVPCRPREYLFNEFKCKACEKGWWPNQHQTGCNQIPIESFDWRSLEALAAIAIALLGLALTLATGSVFIKHNDTPVVKSSTRELSYMILFSMLLCYMSTFFLVAKPNRLTCLVTRCLPGFSFAMMHGALVTKTNRIARILAGSKKIITRRPYFMSATAQVAITWLIVLVECAIILAMLLKEPADSMYEYPSDERVVLVCNTTTVGIMAPLGFDFFLIAMCAVYAFKTRNVPENFNEAKFIGFTMYTTLVIWIAFLVIYFSSDHKVTTLSLCMSFSALFALFLLFFPRCYIVLFKPEKNNRSFFTTIKNVRCHIGYQIGSGGGGGGGGLASSSSSHANTHSGSAAPLNHLLGAASPHQHQQPFSMGSKPPPEGPTAEQDLHNYYYFNSQLDDEFASAFQSTGLDFAHHHHQREHQSDPPDNLAQQQRGCSRGRTSGHRISPAAEQHDHQGELQQDLPLQLQQNLNLNLDLHQSDRGLDEMMQFNVKQPQQRMATNNGLNINAGWPQQQQQQPPPQPQPQLDCRVKRVASAETTLISKQHQQQKQKQKQKQKQPGTEQRTDNKQQQRINSSQATQSHLAIAVGPPAAPTPANANAAVNMSRRDSELGTTGGGMSSPPVGPLRHLLYHIRSAFARRSQRKESDKTAVIQQHLRAIRHAENLDRQTHFRRSQVQRLIQRFDSNATAAAAWSSSRQHQQHLMMFTSNEHQRQDGGPSRQQFREFIGERQDENFETLAHSEEARQLLAVMSQLIGHENVWRLASVLNRYCKQRQLQQQQRGGPERPTIEPSEETAERLLPLDSNQPEEGLKLAGRAPLDLRRPADRRLALAWLRFLMQMAQKAMESVQLVVSSSVAPHNSLHSSAGALMMQRAARARLSLSARQSRDSLTMGGGGGGGGAGGEGGPHEPNGRTNRPPATSNSFTAGTSSGHASSICAPPSNYPAAAATHRTRPALSGPRLADDQASGELQDPSLTTSNDDQQRQQQQQDDDGQIRTRDMDSATDLGLRQKAAGAVLGGPAEAGREEETKEMSKPDQKHKSNVRSKPHDYHDDGERAKMKLKTVSSSNNNNNNGCSHIKPKQDDDDDPIKRALERITGKVGGDSVNSSSAQSKRSAAAAAAATSRVVVVQGRVTDGDHSREQAGREEARPVTKTGKTKNKKGRNKKSHDHRSNRETDGSDTTTTTTTDMDQDTRLHFKPQHNDHGLVSLTSAVRGAATTTTNVLEVEESIPGQRRRSSSSSSKATVEPSGQVQASSKCYGQSVRADESELDKQAPMINNLPVKSGACGPREQHDQGSGSDAQPQPAAIQTPLGRCHATTGRTSAARTRHNHETPPTVSRLDSVGPCSFCCRCSSISVPAATPTATTPIGAHQQRADANEHATTATTTTTSSMAPTTPSGRQARRPRRSCGAGRRTCSSGRKCAAGHLDQQHQTGAKLSASASSGQTTTSSATGAAGGCCSRRCRCCYYQPAMCPCCQGPRSRPLSVSSTGTNTNSSAVQLLDCNQQRPNGNSAPPRRTRPRSMGGSVPMSAPEGQQDC